MPDMNAPIKLGANLWNQYTDWPTFLDGMLRAEDLGYRLAVHLGPRLSHRRLMGGPGARDLHGHGRGGGADQAGHHRPPRHAPTPSAIPRCWPR